MIVHRAGRGLGTGIDLVAPIDGVVLEQMAVPGQRLEAAAPVMKLFSAQEIAV